MKKAVWLVVLVAFAGFGLLQTVLAQDTNTAPKHARPEMKTFKGTIAVSGETKTLKTADGDYVLKSRDPKALEAYTDGQKVEIKGFSRDKDGVKTLYVPGPRGEGKRGKKADKPAAPATE